MSKEVDITYADHFMAGEDKNLTWEIVDALGVPQVMTGWAVSFVLRRGQNSGGSAILTKTAAFQDGDGVNSNALVAFAATDTKHLAPGTYAYSLARVDSGAQSVLAFGRFVISPVTARVA